MPKTDNKSKMAAKLKSNHLLCLSLGILFMFFAGQYARAATVVIGPGETSLTGSIKYSVIGRYTARFDQFSGTITTNDQKDTPQSVRLEIDAASIRSNCGWCDNIVRSKQLLDTTQYPLIIFQSDEIIPEDSGYQVKGQLEMHGRKKMMTFPFTAKIALEGMPPQKTIVASGQWDIYRKDFDITWNRLLDKGGVLVGNYITVKWNINAAITR